MTRSTKEPSPSTWIEQDNCDVRSINHPSAAAGVCELSRETEYEIIALKDPGHLPSRARASNTISNFPVNEENLATQPSNRLSSLSSKSAMEDEVDEKLARPAMTTIERKCARKNENLCNANQ